MRAAVFHKIGDISVDNVDDPHIQGVLPLSDASHAYDIFLKNKEDNFLKVIPKP